MRRPAGSARPGGARSRTGGRRSRGGAASVAGLGARRSRHSGGPGAGSPWTRTSPLQARHASCPVTFCSRIAGTSDSRTAPVRGIRTPGLRRASCDTSGWSGGIGAGSPTRPSSAGTSASARSAPGPHASARISSPRVDERDGRRSLRVRVVRHARPTAEPDRRVARPMGERRERPPEVQRAVDGIGLGGQFRSSCRGCDPVADCDVTDKGAESVLPSGQTCDPETSSRAWRSSPSSSRSPSRVRSDRGVSAPLPLSTLTSSNA